MDWKSLVFDGLNLIGQGFSGGRDSVNKNFIYYIL